MRLSSALQEKARENQRLRSSFGTIKQANDGLRTQVRYILWRGGEVGGEVPH